MRSDYLTKERLAGYRELYEKALALVSEESQQRDPSRDAETATRKSFEILMEVRAVLRRDVEELLPDSTPSDQEPCVHAVMLAFILKDLGRTHVTLEEYAEAEQVLLECLEQVDAYKSSNFGIIPYVAAHNELGLLNGNRKNYEKALEHLLLAEKAYLEFQATGEHALTIFDIFGNVECPEKGKGAEALDHQYTLITFYLAQVYAKMEENAKSAKYCNLTLQRQVKAGKYEAIDFALNAATLSQYYSSNNMFEAARHMMAAANFVMAEHEKTMIKPGMSEEQQDAMKEEFQHRYADLARCWTKYALRLLEASKEHLYSDDGVKLSTEMTALSLEPEDYRIPELDLTDLESTIVAKFLLTFSDARPVYHFLCKWLDKSMEYYNSESQASEYSAIIKDYAELYNLMAFFEEDPMNQAKMHRRRGKYYEDLAGLLNPTYYMPICRDCWYGAGLAYCSVMDIRLDTLKQTNSQNQQDIQKCIVATKKAIENFKLFVKSYTEEDGVTMKPRLDVCEEYNVLYSFFHLARLYYKMLGTGDTDILHDNLLKSLNYYKTFVDQCDKHEEAGARLRDEYQASQDMICLLPMRLASIKASRPTAKN